MTGISFKLSEDEIAENSFSIPGRFRNLTALRFFAAAMVVVDHTEQARNIFGLKNIWKVPTVYALGDKAVTLFFVLSGFLITFLLLKEKRETGTISIKDFYMRRVLRIWPLYFIIVISALFILPAFSFFHWPEWSDYLFEDFGVKVVLFFLILPNAVQVLYPSVPFANQLWSIGVEEQFYLIWPLIIKYVRHHLIFLLIIIIGLPIITAALYFMANGRINDQGLLKVINFLKQFLSLTRIDCMAAGGIAAILLYKQHKIIRYIFHPVVQSINLLLILYIFLTGFYVPYISNMIHGIVFSILILNFAANKHSILNIESKMTNYLGSISYGIYMYHPLGIFIAVKLLFRGHIINSIAFWILLYVLAFSFTVIIASASFRFIEQPLLTIKKRFTPLPVSA